MLQRIILELLRSCILDVGEWHFEGSVVLVQRSEFYFGFSF